MQVDAIKSMSENLRISADSHIRGSSKPAVWRPAVWIYFQTGAVSGGDFFAPEQARKFAKDLLKAASEAEDEAKEASADAAAKLKFTVAEEDK